MQTRPLSDALGLELLDFDITQLATLAQQAELRDLFLEHHLLLIRGQKPTREDQNRFTQYFGPLSLMREGIEAGHISNKPPSNNGELVVTGTKRLLWHADGTYGVHPGIGTCLLALDVTPESTPTQFANAVRALDSLPNALRAQLEGLKVVNYRNVGTETTNQRVREEDIPGDAPAGLYRCFEHPIIYPLPHSDKKVLWVNELATSHVSGVPRDESEALIHELLPYIYDERNVYTHHWENDDVLIWDNIALQHCRPADIGAAPRHLRRLSLDGWNTSEGVLDWPAAGTVRDLEEMAN